MHGAGVFIDGAAPGADGMAPRPSAGFFRRIGGTPR